ncbi:HAD family phosphatase [Streptomyces sp. SID10853]|nr:HAD family phosphatase [Streptomyces sp. SID10853]
MDPDPHETRTYWPEAVVFDHDGVLVDSIGPDLEACRRLFAEYGVDLPAERWAREVCGNTGGYEALFGLLPGTPDTARAHARLRELWRELLVPANVPLMPGVRTLLDRLAERGTRLAVASSADRSWVTRMLGHHGLTAFFDVVVCGDDVARVKPAPDVYRRALALLGVTPGRAVAVEDSLTGVAAARAAGLRVVAVPTPYTRGLDHGAAHTLVTGLGLLTDDLLHRTLQEGSHVPDVR